MDNKPMAQAPLLIVKRYEMTNAKPLAYRPVYRMMEDADGDYVRFSCYTDLTRRLAEVEAAYKHVKQCLHISQGRAKRAEERIQELEDMRND